jgi:hypothetical protein
MRNVKRKKKNDYMYFSSKGDKGKSVWFSFPNTS